MYFNVYNYIYDLFNNSIMKIETIKEFLAIGSFITIIVFGILIFSYLYIDFKQMDIEQKEIQLKNSEWKLYLKNQKNK